MSTQLELFTFDTELSPTDLSTTFIDNMKLPIHRWYRYSAGFSSEWVKQVISDFGKNDICILDPFAGSGTTLIAADECGISAIGYEKQPFIRKIAEAKLSYQASIDQINDIVLKFERFDKNIHFEYDSQNNLLKKCFSKESLYELVKLREYFIENHSDSNAWKIIWLAINGIIRSTSHAGTAQWQYVLPNKKKKNPLPVIAAFKNKIDEIIFDIEYFKRKGIINKSTILDFDARQINNEFPARFDLLITSPPYPNNYDYADATRLEMVFWGEINGWSDLQSKIRKNLIHSCSQHTAAEKLSLEEIIQKNELSPIRDDIKAVCQELEEVRNEHGGKKTYHTMIAAYYFDLSQVFISLRKAMKSGCSMCFVIGDSAPYGVYAPADQWLGKLAIAAGFMNYTFEKTRDRNIKWRNRKHNVPLKEGRLWIKG